MNISILLPYKENFSPEYPGAVSLFVYETSKISKYKKNITVFGNTNFKKKFNLKYENIDLKKDIFTSQTKLYVNKFINIERKYKSSIIEIHNRPSYIHILNSQLKNRILTLYFHNDPLSMEGSKTIIFFLYLLIWLVSFTNNDTAPGYSDEKFSLYGNKIAIFTNFYLLFFFLMICYSLYNILEKLLHFLIYIFPCKLIPIFYLW